MSKNEVSVADLQARVRRTKSLRFFFLLLMPIGFIVPCAIGLLLGQSGGAPQQGFTAAQAFGVAAFALPLIGLAGSRTGASRCWITTPSTVG